MASETTVTLVPGTPGEWREFNGADYDPKAQAGTDEDRLGALIAERTDENPFGVTVLVEPTGVVSDRLVKRLASMQVPTRVKRRSRQEQPLGGQHPDERVEEHPEDEGEDQGEGQHERRTEGRREQRPR